MCREIMGLGMAVIMENQMEETIPNPMESGPQSLNEASPLRVIGSLFRVGVHGNPLLTSTPNPLYPYEP